MAAFSYFCGEKLYLWGMKHFLRIIIIAAILLPIGLQAGAQTVYSVDYKSDADIKVFVSEYKSDADLVVYKTEYKSDATGNNGIWHFVKYKSDAKKKIYFVQYKSDADLIIYFSQWKSDAGWRNNSKKHLMQ